VKFVAEDGTTEILTGEKYGNFEGLYFKYPHDDLYAWCLPTAPGTVHITAPDGTITVERSPGWL
jgi:hypothetical protein